MFNEHNIVKFCKFYTTIPLCNFNLQFSSDRVKPYRCTWIFVKNWLKFRATFERQVHSKHHDRTLHVNCLIRIMTTIWPRCSDLSQRKAPFKLNRYTRVRVLNNIWIIFSKREVSTAHILTPNSPNPSVLSAFEHGKWELSFYVHEDASQVTSPI